MEITKGKGLLQFSDDIRPADRARYFKIFQGYDGERDVIIKEYELEKAFALFLLGGRFIFDHGPVDGKNIQGIVPDYHKTMRWNKGYKLGADDYGVLKDSGMQQQLFDDLVDAKLNVKALIEENKLHLIGVDSEDMEIDMVNQSLRLERKEWENNGIKNPKEISYVVKRLAEAKTVHNSTTPQSA